MQQVAVENTWLTRVEAIALLQVSPFTFVGLVREGRIRKRDTGRRRYWREDVERIACATQARRISNQGFVTATEVFFRRWAEGEETQHVAFTTALALPGVPMGGTVEIILTRERGVTYASLAGKASVAAASSNEAEALGNLVKLFPAALGLKLTREAVIFPPEGNQVYGQCQPVAAEAVCGCPDPDPFLTPEHMAILVNSGPRPGFSRARRRQLGQAEQVAEAMPSPAEGNQVYGQCQPAVAEAVCDYREIRSPAEFESSYSSQRVKAATRRLHTPLTETEMLEHATAFNVPREMP